MRESLSTKKVFWFSLQVLSETFLILRRGERDMIYKCIFFDVHIFVHRKYISKVQPTRCIVFSIYLFLQIALNVLRRFLRPSSGVQNCTYSVRCCQTSTAASCYRGWDGTLFHLIHERSSISSTKAAVLVWQYLTLYVQFCAPGDERRNSLKHAEQFIEINRSRRHYILLLVL